jgi:hypothetical protein
MVGDHNATRGLGLQAQGNINQLQATIYTRQVWANDTSSNVVLMTDEASQFIQNLETTGAQDGLNLSYIVTPKTNVSFNANYSQNANLPSTYSYGPALQTLMYQRNGLALNFNLSATKTQDDEELAVSLTGYFNSVHWMHTATVGYKAVGQNSGNAQPSTGYGDISSYWRNVDAAQQGIQVGLQAHDDSFNQNIGANVIASNERAGFQGSVLRNYVNDNVEQNTQYSVMAATHFAYADNRSAVGGGLPGDTGVIIYVASAHAGDKFDVYVNDQYAATVETEHALPVFLLPFKTYKIRIRDVSQRFYDYEQSSQTVTLYRGNVRTLTWHAKQKLIIYGTLTAHGKVMKNQLVLGGVNPALTDEDGILQAEIYDNTKTLKSQLASGELCTIQLPALRVENGFATVDSLQCIADGKQKISA